MRLFTSIVLTVFVIGCSNNDAQTQRATSENLKNSASNDNVTSKDGDAFDVFVGQEIQSVLDLAAKDPHRKTVRVHAGIYRPSKQSHALIYLNRQHDGITLEAVGEVTLTAANDQLAGKRDIGYPAVVNHVVYFGDGISSRTSLKGFRITGANGFLSDADPNLIEPKRDYQTVEKGMFFHTDGGAIKIFGRSYPTIENLVAYSNSTNLCGGAVSIQHGGFTDKHVTFRNCIFRDNHCPGTGSAVDLLPGSSAVFDNCLFVGNISNTGMEKIKKRLGLIHNEVHGCGALTVFENSIVQANRCTFTQNWNGVDDRGANNQYRNCIFWMNTASDGSRSGGPYEFDIQHAAGVDGCFIHGNIDDLKKTIEPQRNRMDAPDPQFDKSFRPTNPAYQDVGFRPFDRS